MIWNAINGLCLLIVCYSFIPLSQKTRHSSSFALVFRSVRWASVVPITILGTEGFGLPAPYLLSGPFMFGERWLPTVVLAPFGVAILFFGFVFFVVGPWWLRKMGDPNEKAEDL